MNLVNAECASALESSSCGADMDAKEIYWLYVGRHGDAYLRVNKNVLNNNKREFATELPREYAVEIVDLLIEKGAAKAVESDLDNDFHNLEEYLGQIEDVLSFSCAIELKQFVINHLNEKKGA